MGCRSDSVNYRCLISVLTVLMVFAVVICIYNEGNRSDAGIRTITVYTLLVLLPGIALTICVSRKSGNGMSDKNHNINV